ncbi:unnamed protein product [Arabis nemorensis]|uniref:Uncharacterized protein n=1 Tax=Arabis nemorensis TaxID=586526 RepID=A0A565BJB7_9BRAS|nr:unnamed protein product [Arabis nemorensis]
MGPKPDQRLVAMETKVSDLQNELKALKLTSEKNMSVLERIERRIVEVSVNQQRERQASLMGVPVGSPQTSPTFGHRSGKEVVGETSI